MSFFFFWCCLLLFRYQPVNRLSDGGNLVSLEFCEVLLTCLNVRYGPYSISSWTFWEKFPMHYKFGCRHSTTQIMVVLFVFFFAFGAYTLCVKVRVFKSCIACMKKDRSCWANFFEQIFIVCLLQLVGTKVFLIIFIFIYD